MADEGFKRKLAAILMAEAGSICIPGRAYDLEC
jgi:hypothetical protein